MKVLIEVSTEYRFKQKLNNIEGLYATANTRYKNMLCSVNSGDVVIHYITATGLVNVPIPISVPNANDRIKKYLG